MVQPAVSRRTLLKASSGALVGLSVLRIAGPASAFQDTGGKVIPWLDQPAENPVPEIIVKQITWEEVDDWITPTEDFFVIDNFGSEQVIDEATWTLEIGGFVTTPMTLTLADLRARERQEVTATIECSGNSGLPFLTGAIGNATWAGTSLASLLEEAGVQEEGIEVVYWGADSGEQVWRDVTITEHFARSMSLTDAMSPNNLVAWEMNGAPLTAAHGFPARIVAPGWYGSMNAKWLTRIEVRNSRYQGNFMARDFVTIREEQIDGESVWTFTSVRHDRLKSAPAKVTKNGERYTVMGAAWGARVSGVEVRIDDGEWQPATLTDGDGSEFTWTFWTFDWGAPAPGEYAITSRAIGADGSTQPAPDDPFLAGKTTFYESNGQITRRVQIA
jgi:DMSO/TMAO reductase YedYZ molybdopterin-dependent catalytic subunit